MAKRARSDMIATPEFRVFFAQNVFTPNDKGRYTLTMGIPKSADMSTLVGAVQQVAMEAWPETWQAILQASHPIKDGDTLAYTKGERVGQLKKSFYPEFSGMWIIDCGSQNPVGVVDQQVQPIMNQNDFYSGCWAHAKVNAYTYSNDSTGVAIGLGCVQKLREDEAIGGGSLDPAAEFAPIPGFATPQQNQFAPPQQNQFAPPQQNQFAPPQQNQFAPPQQNQFAPPQQNQFAPPQQTQFAPPQQNQFAPPQQNQFAPPQQEFNPPQQQNPGPGMSPSPQPFL